MENYSEIPWLDDNLRDTFFAYPLIQAFVGVNVSVPPLENADWKLHWTVDMVMMLKSAQLERLP